MMRSTYSLVLLVFTLLVSCSKNLEDPLADLARQYGKHPEYSIILQDMDSKGIFFKSYHHMYKVIVGTKPEAGSKPEGGGTPEGGGAPEGKDGLVFNTHLTPWKEVGGKFFNQHKNNLGMVLLSKGSDSKVSRDNYPPGYQYIGNQQYGRWRQDSSGSRFWEFYGKYALFSTVLGMGSRPIHRWDYDRYSDYRSRGSAYYGPSNYYGTRGTLTKKSNPTFFQRQQAREGSRKSSFSDKARSRTGSRSRSASRSGK